MAYLVKLMPRAKRDLRLLFDYIHASESAVAFRWYQGLKREILSLEETPNRCPATPESRNLRHLLCGRKPHVYRVIFEIDESHRVVNVLTIRHGAMEEATPKELR